VKTRWSLLLCLSICMGASLDAAAQYRPSTVTPRVLAKLSDPALSGNGFGVGISGNTVVTTGEGNFVDVFVEPTSGWKSLASPTAVLTCSNAALCTNVAVSGNTVVAVGSTGFGTGNFAVYVFVKPAGGWASMTETAQLTDLDPTQFLGSVGISGNTVAVVAGSSASRVDVFTAPVSGWTNMTPTATLTASNGDYFDAVAMSGGTIVAGAPQYLTNGVGAAYVYVEPASGWANMTESAMLTPTDGAEFGEFGYSVSIGSTAATIVVGAQVNAQSMGAAYVFEEPTAGWTNMTQTAELTESSPVLNSFADSVAVNKSIVVVGAYQEGHKDQGYVYLYILPQGGWVNMTQSAKFTCPRSTGCNDFGRSLSVSGNTIAIGAPGTDGGQALVYAP